MVTFESITVTKQFFHDDMFHQNGCVYVAPQTIGSMMHLDGHFSLSPKRLLKGWEIRRLQGLHPKIIHQKVHLGLIFQTIRDPRRSGIFQIL